MAETGRILRVPNAAETRQVFDLHMAPAVAPGRAVERVQ